MSSEPIVRVEGLVAGYDGNILLQNVNFIVNRGEVFVILGGSGCGKSTLLKHMIGLYPPKTGSVVIDGDDIVTADDATLHNSRKLPAGARVASCGKLGIPDSMERRSS